MGIDPRLLGYLQRALAHEMAAVQQYMAQSQLCDAWGLSDFCTRFREDVGEEIKHVEALIGALVRLGVAPRASALPAVRLARSLEELIAIDVVLEVEAVRLYEEAASYCARVHDDVHRRLFDGILEDELEHLRELDRLRSEHTEEQSRYA